MSVTWGKSEPKQRINLCGDCGQPVGETELLCEECRNKANEAALVSDWDIRFSTSHDW